jgi:plasmid replication initiation protein
MQAGRLRSQGPAFRLRRDRRGIPHRAAALGAQASRRLLLFAIVDAIAFDLVAVDLHCFVRVEKDRRQALFPKALQHLAVLSVAILESGRKCCPSLDVTDRGGHEGQAVAVFRQTLDQASRTSRQKAGAPRKAAWYVDSSGTLT